MAGTKKTQTGKVISNKMDKTAVVEVSRRVQHPFFHKYHVKRKKYKVHDEKNECGVGDRVLMRECPPVSREKRWVVVQILEKAVAV